MVRVREPAVAGMFYAADPQDLADSISGMLAQADCNLPIPKALIAPHAGYVYSGPIAASAYACLQKTASIINRVILFGPSHRYSLSGLAAPKSDYFATPLGRVKIDHSAILLANSLPQVEIIEEAHALEHSLEVQLPFLQTVLGEFTLAPFVVGMASAQQVAEVMELLWDGKNTLIVVSSDLSHYHNYNQARQMDQTAANAIVRCDPDGLDEEQACGRMAIISLLLEAKVKGLTAKLIDLRNSGDTAGSHDQVVGYGAFHFYEK